MADSIFGYYTSADQDPRSPTYDPGLAVPCPICLRQLAAPLKTVSLMKIGDNRAFFFRAHKGCWDEASEEDRRLVESSLMDTRLTEKQEAGHD